MKYSLRVQITFTIHFGEMREEKRNEDNLQHNNVMTTINKKLI